MVKNITLSAEETVIRKAREKAEREHTTLNASFRKWLKQYAGKKTAAMDYSLFMDQLSYAKPGRRFSREESNER
jgi:hypothetical protein